MILNGREVQFDPGVYEALVADGWILSVSSFGRTGREYVRGYRVPMKPGDTVTPIHRVLVGFPSGCVDHINRDSLDNRASNLRVITHQQNLMNRGKTRASKNRFKGITRTKNGQYAASITINYRRFHLGFYATDEEAASAYDWAAYSVHPGIALLNFPEQAEIQSRPKHVSEALDALIKNQTKKG